MVEKVELRWTAWCLQCPWTAMELDEHKIDRKANAHDLQWKKLGREHHVCVERVAFAEKFDPELPPTPAPWEKTWAQQNGTLLP